MGQIGGVPVFQRRGKLPAVAVGKIAVFLLGKESADDVVEKLRAGGGNFQCLQNGTFVHSHVERGLRQFVQSRVNGGVCGGYLRGVDLLQLLPTLLRIGGFDPAETLIAGKSRGQSDGRRPS